jgi:hypothetical protein
MMMTARFVAATAHAASPQFIVRFIPIAAT